VAPTDVLFTFPDKFMSQEMSELDSRAFRDALGSYPTGVAVITTLDESGKAIGMTVNSFSSVSLDPPLVLWSIDKKSAFFDVFSHADHYAVHVLRSDQKQLSHDFSSEDPDHFAEIEYDKGIANLPLLKSCSALFQCKVRSRYDEGDHVILIGRVLDIRNFPAESLVFVEGGYKRIVDH
jgi:flavin reductase (DIM6/NTAB) family NADH-FMN oxidoreductase RutF